MINGIPIVYSDVLITRTMMQARRHRKRRINKKWLKRYGFKEIIKPDSNVYLIDGGYGIGKQIFAHPSMRWILEGARRG